MTQLIEQIPSLNGITPELDPPRNWPLSASDLTFAWSDCRRCFYHRIRDRLLPPRSPMPAIFNRLDGGMKSCFQGQRVEAVVSELPPGVFSYADEWVESVPISLPGRRTSVTLKGRFDTVVAFDDPALGFANLDFKTCEPKPEYVGFYSRQLHAYAMAMERPARGRRRFNPVSRLGLLVFEPQRFVHRRERSNGIAGYFGGGLHWMEIHRDDVSFLAFLSEVVGVLDDPEPPPSSTNCACCRYREIARETGW